ncbi:hypothetical protein NP233_g4182 [Leucocoprinus birnbaumii]|uniref:Uncharacterized protein n=1 Tax=Leucocoprinus birnbaumii TaxID=56174 RepID=A0AAD5VVJ7_9AGAR|nr:hypothetical protein NP233_g4182 [Leucocoprinus birnbaumii]
MGRSRPRSNANQGAEDSRRKDHSNHPYGDASDTVASDTSRSHNCGGNRSRSDTNWSFEARALMARTTASILGTTLIRAPTVVATLVKTMVVSETIHARDDVEQGVEGHRPKNHDDVVHHYYAGECVNNHRRHNDHSTHSYRDELFKC